MLYRTKEVGCGAGDAGAVMLGEAVRVLRHRRVWVVFEGDYAHWPQGSETVGRNPVELRALSQSPKIVHISVCNCVGDIEERSCRRVRKLSLLHITEIRAVYDSLAVAPKLLEEKSAPLKSEPVVEERRTLTNRTVTELVRKYSRTL